MKNFKDKKLYDSEIGRYKTFLEKKLITDSEYDKFDTGEEEEDLEGMPFDPEITLGFDSDSMDSFSSSIDSGLGDFGGFDFGGGSSYGDVDFKKHTQERNQLQLFLKSPVYLSDYTFNSLIYNTKDTNGDGINDSGKQFNFDLNKAKEIFKYMSIAGAFLFSTSVLGKFVDFNTLHNQTFGMIGGASFLLAGQFFNWKYFNKGLISKFYQNPNPKAEEINSNSNEDSELNFGDDSEISFDGFGSDDEEPTTFNFDEDDLDVDDAEDKFDIEDEDDDDDDNNLLVLKNTTIDSSDTFNLKAGLEQEFSKNNRYKGVYLTSRKEILDSFSGLLLSNDTKFSKWKTIHERTTIYNNLAYTIYKSLIDINKNFSNRDDKEAKLIIVNMEQSPLLYKVKLKLPQKYFKGSVILSKNSVFDSYLKASDDDSDVQTNISVSGDVYTFRFTKLDYRGLISIGDILRYKDDSGQTAYQKMTSPKALSPMLVGLKNSEYPHVVDLEKNTAMAIVGGSGSGKSWLTYELGTNLVTTNDFNELNFVVLDYKNAPFWQSFARMPHVVGYHSPRVGLSKDEFIEKALKISNEIVRECNRRQEVLSKYNKEDAIEFREYYRDTKEYDKLKEMPLLIFVIDEITSTMGAFKDMDKDMYDSFRNNLNTISQVGRSAGVRLLTVGQRSIDTSLPKNVIANTSLLFGMKMDNGGDFGILFSQSKEVDTMPKPQGAGQGIIKSQDILGYHSLKTLTPGGKNNSEIRMVLRTIAFDWLRRASGREDLYVKPTGVEYIEAYNRNEYLDESYKELKQGCLLEPNVPNANLAMDLLNDKVSINTVIDFKDEDKSEDTSGFNYSNSQSDSINTFDDEDEDFSTFDNSNFNLNDIANSLSNSDFYSNEKPSSNSLEDEEDSIKFDFSDDSIEDSFSNEDDNVEYDSSYFENLLSKKEESEPESFDFSDFFINKENETSEKDNSEKDKVDSIPNIDFIKYEKEEELRQAKLKEEELEAKNREMEQLIKELENQKKMQEELLNKKLKDELEAKAKELEEKERKFKEDLAKASEINSSEKETKIEKPKPKVVKVVQRENKPTITKNNLDIREFIVTNGKKISDFEYALDKESIYSNYKKSEVSKAIRIGDILEANNAFIAEL